MRATLFWILVISVMATACTGPDSFVEVVHRPNATFIGPKVGVIRVESNVAEAAASLRSEYGENGERIEAAGHHAVYPGNYFFEFNPIEGYDAPSSRVVRVRAGSIYTVTLVYTKKR